jgi:hypothetical protein
MNLKALLKSELENLERSYQLAIDGAIALLQNERTSMHLGHNLASRANEISVLAGKIESTRTMIFTLDVGGL